MHHEDWRCCVWSARSDVPFECKECQTTHWLLEILRTRRQIAQIRKAHSSIQLTSAWNSRKKHWRYFPIISKFCAAPHHKQPRLNQGPLIDMCTLCIAHNSHPCSTSGHHVHARTLCAIWLLLPGCLILSATCYLRHMLQLFTAIILQHLTSVGACRPGYAPSVFLVTTAGN